MKMRIPGFSRTQATLRFRSDEWAALIRELGRRGQGKVESGAFLLSDKDDARGLVSRIAYYDDLDPDCLQGGISLRGFAYSRLWGICEAEGLRLVADVHTHPGVGVRQSSTDREHPMYAQAGHIALIIPNLATRAVAPAEVGVHEYLGDRGWRSHFGREAKRLIYVGRRP